MGNNISATAEEPIRNKINKKFKIMLEKKMKRGRKKKKYCIVKLSANYP